MRNRLLLDSHTILWVVENNSSLGQAARAMIKNAEIVYVSAASIWELRIKEMAGKLEIPSTFQAEVRRAGMQELPVSFEHANTIRVPQLTHKDPFDRMLLAQAYYENLVLITADQMLLQDPRSVDART